MSDGTFAIIGAGAVGRAVAQRLVIRGIEPTVISRSGTPIPGARSVAADVRSQAALGRAIDNADVVFQCAQPPYHRWAQEFPDFQRNVVDVCVANGAALIVAENLYGYGTPGRPISEASPYRPTTRKGRVRLAMSEELLAAHHDQRLSVAMVRASDFFGPGVAGSAYGERFFPPLAAGKAAQVMGDPDTLHSVTFIDDFAEALVTVAEDPTAWGRAWIAPTAPAVSQRQLVEMAADVAKVKPKLRPVGPLMLRLAGLFSPPAKEMIEMLGEFTADYLVDSTAAEERFGLQPTPLADAIALTMAACRPDHQVGPVPTTNRSD